MLPEQGFTDESVHVVELVRRDHFVGDGLVDAVFVFGALLDLLVERQGDVEHNPSGEAERDGDISVFKSVDSLKKFAKKTVYQIHCIIFGSRLKYGQGVVKGGGKGNSPPPT